MQTASVTVDNGTLKFRFPYNPTLLNDMKVAVPASARAWDGASKTWRIDPTHGQTVANLIAQHTGQVVAVPQVKTTAALETRLLDLRYIGQTKNRDGEEPTAYGYVDGSWSTIFPESVLRKWFLAPARPDEAPTLYQVLGVHQTANTDDLKKAYRRLAFQWHPDRSKEPDAAQMFIAIQHAYESLSNPNMRVRYDAGLYFQAQAQTQPDSTVFDKGSYRPPLRCGYVMAEGVNRLGRFLVSEILAWEDIVIPDGRILSTSWPVGADIFVEVWS